MSPSSACKIVGGALLLGASLANANAACNGPSCVKDFPIAYPNKATGSTHEITFKRGGDSFWVTAPNYDAVVNIGLNGPQKFYNTGSGSGPHGIVFNAAGQLFVTLEKRGQVVRLDRQTGKIEATYDLTGADPHGLGVAADGKTLWFAAKMANTVGSISPNGAVKKFVLPTAGAVPIYIAAGPDGNMWFTELEGGKIGRVSANGTIAEFQIPTLKSRPIAIVPDPRGKGMWFSEEAGNKVAHIETNGAIAEFAVPKSQANVILAGLAFDGQGNLWTQAYVDQNNPGPPGPDHVIKIGNSILTATANDKLAFTFYEVPTRQTVMHRIIQGPDLNMWFTELKSDRIGRVDTK